MFTYATSTDAELHQAVAARKSEYKPVARARQTTSLKPGASVAGIDAVERATDCGLPRRTGSTDARPTSGVAWRTTPGFCGASRAWSTPVAPETRGSGSSNRARDSASR